MLYFAYGSNMSYRRLAARIAKPKIISTATLKGYQLKFNKPGMDGSAKCSIDFTDNFSHVTYGVVFEINQQEKILLDKYEGLGNGYCLKSVALQDNYGSQLEAITYQATIFSNQLLPFEWYHQHVIFGAQEANLPNTYIEQLTQINTQPDPDIHRHTREVAIYD